MHSPIKVSVIIPVYNTAAYLRQCLESLQRQTLREIELICIDDGSTDDSLSILREYGAKDEKIVILETLHQTAGGARNKGLETAQGEYIICLDSDDFFEQDMLENMYAKASAENLDLIVCCADRYLEEKREFEPAPWWVKLPLWEKMKGQPFCPRKDMPRDIFQLVAGNPWTKMWKRTFIREYGLRYQPIVNSNDTFFTYAGLFLAQRVSYTNKVFVHWRVRSNSLTTGFSKSPVCFVDALCALTQRIRAHKDASRVKASLIELSVEISTWRYDRTPDCSKRDVEEAVHTRMEPCCQILPYLQNHIKTCSRLQKAKFGKYLHILGCEYITTFVIPIDLRKSQSWCLLENLHKKLPIFTNAIIPVVAINECDKKRLPILEKANSHIAFLRWNQGEAYEIEESAGTKIVGRTIIMPGIISPTILPRNKWEQMIQRREQWRALSSASLFIINHFEYPWKFRKSWIEI